MYNNHAQNSRSGQMSLEQAELQPLFSVRSVMSPAVSYPGGKKGKRQVPVRKLISCLISASHRKKASYY